MNARRTGDHRASDAAVRPLAGNIRLAHGSWTRGDGSYWSAAHITIGPMAVCSAGLFTPYSGVDEMPTRLPGTPRPNLAVATRHFAAGTFVAPVVEFVTSVNESARR
jgi:hypothetical protein